jgi:His-Xaa-Ser system protein HxsD
LSIDARARKVQRVVDPKVYSLDAIFGAAYVLLGRAWVHLDRDRKGQIVVTLKSKTAASREELLRLGDDFENELVDQVVRLQLAKRHVKLREMIVGRAMFGATGVGAEQTGVGDGADDYLADPLGIAVPWEERFIGVKKVDAEKKDEPDAPPATGTEGAE